MNKHYPGRAPLVLPNGVESVVQFEFRDDNRDPLYLNLPLALVPSFIEELERIRRQENIEGAARAPQTLQVSTISGNGPLPGDQEIYEVHLGLVEAPGGASFSASLRFQTKEARWLATHILADLQQRGLP
jgi:hypothetical protein